MTREKEQKRKKKRKKEKGGRKGKRKIFPGFGETDCCGLWYLSSGKTNLSVDRVRL